MNINKVLKTGFCVVIFVLLVYVVRFGLKYRSTYTDYINEPDFYDIAKVACLDGDMAVAFSEREKTSLMHVPIIIRATPVEEHKDIFMCTYQLLLVKEVFKGDGISAGEKILLVSTFWRAETLQFLPPIAIARRFVNYMRKDSDYLVFISKKVDQLYSDIPVYNVFDEDDGRITIPGVFCYEEIKNVLSDHISSSSTYVPYKDVKENEFFSTSENGLKAMESLKQYVLEAFPAGSMHE